MSITCHNRVIFYLETMAFLGAAKEIYVIGALLASVPNMAMTSEIIAMRTKKNSDVPRAVQSTDMLFGCALGLVSAAAFPITTPLLRKWDISLHESEKK